ncbi:MAG: hypothetical protein JWR80_2898 [Bradyrhizobium sp.]|nr:hypothetical protein [Bradyrhizobium sp.]
MSLIAAQIVAPDSAHWADWIDDALSSDRQRRTTAREFHQRLLDQGRIPFLSWHNLEELLGISDAANARDRIAYLQSLPLIAWMRAPGAEVGLGAVIDIIAQEAAVFLSGCEQPREIRDRVRARLMRTGPAIDAIGTENWVWEEVRPFLLQRKSQDDMIAALADTRNFDDSQTVGQLVDLQLRDADERARKLAAIHENSYRDAMAAQRRRTPAQGAVIADAFIARAMAGLPATDMPIRDFILSTYVAQGLDADEVRDECRIADLSCLGTFRTQLRTVAELTGHSFEQLKRVRMEAMPSWNITEALRLHGQVRQEKPGSDVIDGHLAVLAAYTDTLYVDRRTHQDFLQMLRKAPQVAALIGNVAKVPHFTKIADPGTPG